ncbi:MAG TPA: protein kinase [Blastocatellia bacterium]|nr:protein kinase [Blastocatellia bacterium]
MIGQVIGSYRIEQKIGEGGMGAVYRGRDLMLEREVAVKALRPELARQPELVARFRSEAVTLARLNHSHVATLYNFLRHGDDFFMVMEFVRGRTLDELIKQSGAIEVERAVRLFCQALEGIAHAHALGVIHRDIKPANLMLAAGDDVKVMDFGIARVLGTARQTKTGRLIGTLEYMSPEQMRGMETDARADIYSLGILLYEMLTGRVPFECHSDYELMRAQVEDEPPAPREFKGDIPLPVELAVMRALAKDPAARFQSAAEFRAALISAVPAAAIRPEPVQPVVKAEPEIKATRQAAGLGEEDFGSDWPGSDELIKGTRMPQSSGRNSGFDSTTGTFTLKLPAFLVTVRQQVESRLGPLNWKHYGGAAAAMLALTFGVSALRGGNQPAPARYNGPQSVTTQPATAPANDPAPVAPAVTPLARESDLPPAPTSAAAAEEKPEPRTKPAMTPKPRPSRPQVASNSQPQPTARPVQPQHQPAPAPPARPTPTPTPGKMDKTIRVIEAIGGIIKKRKQ